MEPSQLEISDLRLRLRALPSRSNSIQFKETSDILDEIAGLGRHAGQLVPDMIAAMQGGVLMPPQLVVPIIVEVKSSDLLSAMLAQENGRYQPNTHQRCALLLARFPQFEAPLLDELSKSFEEAGSPRCEIVDALAVAGTHVALDTLRVIEYRTASRLPELRAELSGDDEGEKAANQVLRGEFWRWTQEFLEKVRRAIKCIDGRPEPQPANLIEVASTAPTEAPESVSTLLNKMENDKLEFKAALRWDPARGAVDENLERRVLRTVAGFANATGGTLLLGVDPNRKVVGLEKDYCSLKGDSDQFERHLRQLIQNQFEKTFTISNVKISFHRLEGKEICCVVVEPVLEPLFIKSNGKEEFFVRNGNAMVLLEGQDMAKYLKQHFHA
jgi:hypothetical protein